MSSAEPAIIAEFDYRPHRLLTTALLCLATAGAVLLTYFAFTLDQPIEVRGFQLTPAQGRMFFGTFAILTPIGLIPLASAVYVAFVENRRVALTRHSILLPRPTVMGLSCDEIEIPLDAITSATLVNYIGNTCLLQLEHPGGLIGIPSNMLATRKQFEQLTQLVQTAVEAARRAKTEVPA